MAVESGGGSRPSGPRPRRPQRTAPTAGNPPSTAPRAVQGPNEGPLTRAFRAAYGGSRLGDIRYTYLGKDKYGNPIYKFSYAIRGARGGMASRTLAYVNGKFVAPNSARSAQPDDIPGQDEVEFGGSTDRSELIDRAVAKLGDLVSRGLITSEQAKTYDFTGWTDTALRMWISRAGTGNRVSPSVIESAPGWSAEEMLGDVFDGGFGGGGGGFGGGGGGGGGGGSLLPTYRGPDKRVVEDFVKGSLVSLVGTVPEHLIGPNVELYMREHRRNFDEQVNAELAGKDSFEVDPSQSVLNAIRGTQEYKVIHKLRPKSVDERTWVSDRAQQAVQGGLSNSRVEDFAITQATAGADIQDVAQAGAIAEFQATGQAPDLLENKFKAVAQSMFGRVGR